MSFMFPKDESSYYLLIHVHTVHVHIVLFKRLIICSLTQPSARKETKTCLLAWEIFSNLKCAKFRYSRCRKKRKNEVQY